MFLPSGYLSEARLRSSFCAEVNWMASGHMMVRDRVRVYKRVLVRD